MYSSFLNDHCLILLIQNTMNYLLFQEETVNSIRECGNQGLIQLSIPVFTSLFPLSLESSAFRGLRYRMLHKYTWEELKFHPMCIVFWLSTMGSVWEKNRNANITTCLKLIASPYSGFTRFNINWCGLMSARVLRLMQACDPSGKRWPFVWKGKSLQTRDWARDSQRACV